MMGLPRSIMLADFPKATRIKAVIYNIYLVPRHPRFIKIRLEGAAYSYNLIEMFQKLGCLSKQYFDDLNMLSAQ